VVQDFSPLPGALAPGDHVAGYQVEQQIGRGGMAVVYRALDLRLGRQVALKVLDPHLAEDEAFRQRFIRESRAAAGVDHPHIIPVFEAGQAGDLLFIAMRYVSFGDVRALIETEGRLGVARAASITAQVASALDAAHAHGLIHRDVKPGNVLLAGTGGSGTDHVYLSDFGLSKHSLAATTLTAAGQFMGTLDYVSPEQIQGQPADGRADQYGLACTAVEMLTGAPPFKRDESMALLWAQLEALPPPVTQRRPELPPAIDTVIRTALAKSPADRYPTCLAFASALRAACDAGPATIRPAGPAAAPTTAARATSPSPAAAPPQARPVPPVPAAAPGPTRAEPVPILAAQRPETGAVLQQPAPTEHALSAAAPPARLDEPRKPGEPPAPDRIAAPLWRDRPRQPAATPAPERRSPQRPPGQGTGRTPDRHLVAQRPQVRRRKRGRLVAWSLAIVLAAGLAGLGYKLFYHPAKAGQPITSVTTTPPPAVSTPGTVVQQYFAAINAHDYQKAWNLGGKNQGQSYQKFVDGFSGTAQDIITILSTSGNVVTAHLTATQTVGPAKHFQGTYTVANGEITFTNVHGASS
jgi:tRNA A-37 threonylcarbamoyl transferase component Bud32